MVGTRNNSLSTANADGPRSCRICDTPVGSADYSVNCEYCSALVHHECGGFNDQSYAAFKKLQATGVVLYHCPDCKVEIANLATRVAVLESQVGDPSVTSESRLQNVEKKLDAITKSLESLVPVEHGLGVTAVPSGQRKSYSAVASTGVVSQARVVVADLQRAKEEESHRRSIVVAGLPEKGQDNLDVSNLVKFLDPSAIICEAYRMGRLVRSADGNSRPRLLKVHLPSSSVVKSVLGESRNLKDSEEFRGVFIRRSMTIAERKELGRLRAKCLELNQKEEAEGVKYVVWNEHLVKFTGCRADASGRLSAGTRSRSWIPSADVNSHVDGSDLN